MSQCINHVSGHFRLNATSFYEYTGESKLAILSKKCQKFKFFQSGRKCPESHYMAGNGYPRCRRHILHQNLISKHVLNEIWEIRKKSIFKIFDYDFSENLAENKPFPADNRPNNIGTRQDTPKTLSRKNGSK